MTEEFKPSVEYSRELIEELSQYSSVIKPIYSELESEKVISLLANEIPKIEYHAVNIIMLKRQLIEDFYELSHLIDHPESATNFRLQKATRTFFTNIESTIDAINLAISDNHKKIDDLKFNISDYYLPDIKAIRNHSVHEGFFGIIKPQRPTEIPHMDAFTHPRETEGYYIIDDNGIKTEIYLSEIRTNYIQHIERLSDGLLTAILEKIKSLS
ncbi:hypothetical protein [Paenibacillus harenae]|uniref:Cthe-2314-like HEPN domain-containing protein n=1 Tax=Paenibacillus harenae TaxID=306543 RepID=A0ABT9TYL0_PAEHA|nr:hypothetical protein [Paenibacillus harenae]MDQ0112453.1 hypothetical protein [Paenibacillus harenae]